MKALVGALLQPLECPSRGLHCDCENRWIVCHSSPLLYPVHWPHGPRRAASIKWVPWCWNTANTHLTEQLVERGRVVESGENRNWIFGRKENCSITLLWYSDIGGLAMVRSGVSLCAPLLVNIIAFDQERINGAKAENTLIHQRFWLFCYVLFSEAIFLTCSKTGHQCC